jgi:hypothetical protein
MTGFEQDWEIKFFSSDRSFPIWWDYDTIDARAVPDGMDVRIRVVFPVYSTTVDTLAIEIQNTKPSFYLYSPAFATRAVQRLKNDEVKLPAELSRAYALALYNVIQIRPAWQRRMNLRAPLPVPQPSIRRTAIVPTVSKGNQLQTLGLSRLADYARYMTEYDPDLVLQLTYETAMSNVMACKVLPVAQWRALGFWSAHKDRDTPLPDDAFVSLYNVLDKRADEVSAWTQSLPHLLGPAYRRIVIPQQAEVASRTLTERLGGLAPGRVPGDEFTPFLDLDVPTCMVVMALCGRHVLMGSGGVMSELTKTSPGLPSDDKEIEAVWSRARDFIRHHHLPEIVPVK